MSERPQKIAKKSRLRKYAQDFLMESGSQDYNEHFGTQNSVCTRAHEKLWGGHTKVYFPKVYWSTQY